METKRSTFKGRMGFVLAAAGSAVGLGNIWRFPYLAARDGGGLFLVIYLILALTFGYTMLTSEIAIGRRTKQGPLTAYGRVNRHWKFIGVFACLVPILIMPYYCVIGGWVVKYFLEYLTGNGRAVAKDGYFTSFITSQWQPIVMWFIFFGACAYIIFKGVNAGVERFSRISMPILIVLIVVIAIFSVCIHDPGDSGRTGLQGLGVMFIPDVRELTLKTFFITLMDATGQLFFSLSVAMGIMVAYGSYMKDDEKMSRSINQIEIFDTSVAFLAGIMIIPAVFVFMGRQGMESSGPGLMFVTLPKVFSEMGAIGNVVGTLFFAMVLFASLTSAVSIMEAVVASFCDQFHISRNKSAITESIIAIILGMLVCLGYNVFYFEVKLPNGATAQLLDIFDYISNQVLMPIVAISTCILVGYVCKPQYIREEVEKNGGRFGRRRMYTAMVKVIAPVLLTIIFLMAIGIIKL